MPKNHNYYNEKNIALKMGELSDEMISENINLKNTEQNWPSKDEEIGELLIDLYQTPDELILESTIAGVEPKDLDISIANDMVIISGKRERRERMMIEGFYFQECFWGTFTRSIVLPQEVDADKAKATFKNGMLFIRLPKLERTRIKKLRIETEDEF